MKKPMLNIAIYSFIFLLIDQITKGLVLISIQDAPFTLIPGFAEFHYSRNFGIAFSIPVPFVLLILLNIILLAVILIFCQKELKVEKPITQLILALIVGGGLGNLLDRFVHGFVVDFISIWRYPIFNVADIFISLGVLLLLLFYSKINRNTKTQTNGKSSGKSSRRK